MGKRSADEKDQAIAKFTGAFAGTGSSAAIELHGNFNVVIVGGTATVRLERSFDGGTTWIAHASDRAGTAASWSVTASSAHSMVFFEPEHGVLYRLTCTAFTSAVTYRISQ